MARKKISPAEEGAEFPREHFVDFADLSAEPVHIDGDTDLFDVSEPVKGGMFLADQGYNALRVVVKLRVRDTENFVLGSAATPESFKRVVRLSLTRGETTRALATKTISFEAIDADQHLTIGCYMDVKPKDMKPGNYKLTATFDGMFSSSESASFSIHKLKAGSEVSDLFVCRRAGFLPVQGYYSGPEDLHSKCTGLDLNYYIAEEKELGMLDEMDDDDVPFANDSDWSTRNMLWRTIFVVESAWKTDSEGRHPKGEILYVYANGEESSMTAVGHYRETPGKEGQGFFCFSAPDPEPDAPLGPIYVELKIMGTVIAGFVGEKLPPNGLYPTTPSDGGLTGDDLKPIEEYTLSKGMRAIKNRVPVAVKNTAMEALDHMVGLADVKQKVSSYMALVRFHQLRAKRGIATKMPPLHALFLGSPGTGKTTVATLMGRLMKEAGVLSKGHMVVLERSQIVGHRYGDETESIRKALDDSLGGVLFIDEAYTLYKECDPKDPGREAIEALLTALANPERRDWMLILGGYEDKILKMFEVNPGLASRFPLSNYYRFADYTADDLMEIARRFCKDNFFELSPEAEDKLAAIMVRDVARKDNTFGNARHVLNLLETEVFPAMAARVDKLTNPGEKELTLIVPEDLPDGDTVRPGFNTGKHVRNLGFRV